MWPDLKPTIEAALKFLIIASAVIFVLWVVNRFLHDTISAAFSGIAKEVREFSLLTPHPRSLNLIGGMVMLGALVIFARGNELSWFSQSTLAGNLTMWDIAFPTCGALVIGAYFLLCIRACKDAP